MPRPMSTLLAAIAAQAALVAPAFAADRAFETQFDMRATMEYQSWAWASPTGARLDYAMPMTTYTIVDHTGAILGAATTVAGNEARRRSAEDDAIRRGERQYSYRVEEGRAMQGTRTSFTVGQGGIGGFTTSGVTIPAGTTNSSRMAKIGLEGDLFEALGGVFVFESGVAYWSATAFAPGAAPGAGKPLDIEAWNWPLGLRYRIAPAFVPGLLIEAGGTFDWLYTAYYATQGGARWDARNLSLEVGYMLHPQVKLRAGYQLNRLAHNAVPWMKVEDVVDMKNATAGVTLGF